MSQVAGICFKCGHGSILPRYDASRDKLIYRCPCGFEWSTDPLNKRQR